MEDKVEQNFTAGEDIVINAEHERIKIRRRQAKLSEGSPERDAVGLGFSGGGIRSATFNLGLLQAMDRYGLLKHVDYLSTVSGGGYIGSSLTWFMSSLKQGFPFGTSRRHNLGTPGAIVSWLREHASYLIPGQGLNLWSLVAFIIGGTLVNLLVVIPFFFAITLFLTWLPGPEIISGYPQNGFTGLLAVGIVSLALLMVAFVFYALLSGVRSLQQYRIRYRTQIWLGRILSLGAGLLILGTVPLVHGHLDLYFHDWIEEFNTSFSAAGALSLIGGAIGRNRKNETRGYRKVLLNVGLALVIYGLLQWIYHGADAIVHGDRMEMWMRLISFFIVLSIIIGVFANINYVSIHRYYRDRLMQAFMPPEDFINFGQPNKCLLKDIPQTDAPYQIINSMMMTWCSPTPKLQLRGGDNFIFSPLFCGAKSTGYAPSAEYLGGTMDLSTAFSISGAAVDPNTGETHSRPLSFIQTLLNLRIGYWARNPKWPATVIKGWSRPYWLVYSLRQMLGLELAENQMHVYLSDGGHFENLALYELIRRQCRYIILSDAGQDYGRNFGDLGNALEKVRVDFGVAIDIDTKALRPESNGFSSQPWVLGDIYYADGSRGVLLYIKASVFSGLPEDVYAYLRANPMFPHQSTADQFFNEPQFEAYRELGFQTGKQIFEGKQFNKIFTC
jgi:hypothetical protein